jgi:hypothetical protein
MSELIETNGNGVTVDDSRLFGISLRGWLTLMVVGTICGLAVVQIEVKEPLYSIGALTVGFYFGQKTKK